MVVHIVRFEHLGKQLQIMDSLADGNTELVCIDQPVKVMARPEPFIGNL